MEKAGGQGDKRDLRGTEGVKPAKFQMKAIGAVSKEGNGGKMQ